MLSLSSINLPLTHLHRHPFSFSSYLNSHVPGLKEGEVSVRGEVKPKVTFKKLIQRYFKGFSLFFWLSLWREKTLPQFSGETRRRKSFFMITVKECNSTAVNHSIPPLARSQLCSRYACKRKTASTRERDDHIFNVEDNKLRHFPQKVLFVARTPILMCKYPLGCFKELMDECCVECRMKRGHPKRVFIS